MVEIGQPTGEGHRFRGDGTYLITGGAGGFGLELAGWMAKNGARHFALMSRSGPNAESLEKIEAYRAADESLLNQPAPEPMRGRFQTLGILAAALLSMHFALHNGQLSAWRRAMGLPSVM